MPAASPARPAAPSRPWAAPAPAALAAVGAAAGALRATGALADPSGAHRPAPDARARLLAALAPFGVTAVVAGGSRLVAIHPGWDRVVKVAVAPWIDAELATEAAVFRHLRTRAGGRTPVVRALADGVELAERLVLDPARTLAVLPAVRAELARCKVTVRDLIVANVGWRGDPAVDRWASWVLLDAGCATIGCTDRAAPAPRRTTAAQRRAPTPGRRASRR